MKTQRPQSQTPKKHTFRRILKTLIAFYPALVPLTAFCILFSSVVAAVPDVLLRRIIAVIETWQPSRDWASASKEIIPQVVFLAVLYLISLAAVLLYTQLMARITQGYLYKLRGAMFNGMQNLPIRYFDTHKHGDIMSYYTNDIDTLRQLVSQAFPAFIRSGVTVLSVLGIMLYYSVWMTLILLGGVVVMMFVSKTIGGGSAKFFLRQQK